jgi:hypothetical protein
MWVLLDFKTVQKLSGDKYLSIKGQQEYDCVGEQARFLTIQYLSKRMGNGAAIFKNTDPGDWYPVPSRGMTGILWKVACRRL